MIAEVNIFRLYLFNDEFRKKIQNHITQDIFNNVYIRELIQLVNEYYVKHSKMPINCIKMLIYNNNLRQPKEIIDEKISIVDVDTTYYQNIEYTETLKDFEVWLKNQKYGAGLQQGIDEYENALKENRQVNITKHNEFNKDILSISFESDNGIYVNNSQLMFNEHRRKDRKIKFNNKELNEITKGGTTIPSLNLVVASPHAGKTRFLCTIAKDYLISKIKNNVLYVTLEMSETQISKYIDYILIDKNEEEIENMSFEEYDKIKKQIDGKIGNLYVKEFYSSSNSITTAHIRSLLEEYKNKGININVLIVDYIGIMGSELLKVQTTNTNIIGKAVSQELRGLSGEYDIAIWSAAQINRVGTQKKTNVGMDDIAESFALNATADLILMIINNDDLKKQERQVFKVEKNRPGGKTGQFLYAEVPKDKYVVNFINIEDALNNVEDIIEQSKEITSSELTQKFTNINNNNNKDKYKIGLNIGYNK